MKEDDKVTAQTEKTQPTEQELAKKNLISATLDYLITSIQHSEEKDVYDACKVLEILSPDTPLPDDVVKKLNELLVKLDTDKQTKILKALPSHSITTEMIRGIDKGVLIQSIGIEKIINSENLQHLVLNLSDAGIKNLAKAKKRDEEQHTSMLNDFLSEISLSLIGQKPILITKKVAELSEHFDQNERGAIFEVVSSIASVTINEEGENPSEFNKFYKQLLLFLTAGKWSSSIAYSYYFDVKIPEIAGALEQKQLSYYDSATCLSQSMTNNQQLTKAVEDIFTSDKFYPELNDSYRTLRDGYNPLLHYGLLSAIIDEGDPDFLKVFKNKKIEDIFKKASAERSIQIMIRAINIKHSIGYF